MKAVLALVIAALTATPVAAQDVLIVGEIHDNPDHHAVQAAQVRALQPAVIVFEMLTRTQAGLISNENRRSAAELGRVLGWADSGWPDFAMYYPIFAAAPRAQIYGGQVPREDARRAITDGPAQIYGTVSEIYGLDTPLPAAQQAAREALQMAAHCDALPQDLLPGMVGIQRLRDAVLADAVVKAMADTGGPVVVITGNGHARRDWGIPALLAGVAPDLQVRVIGQTEDDAPIDGGFDVVLSAPGVARPDPCATFK